MLRKNLNTLMLSLVVLLAAKALLAQEPKPVQPIGTYKLEYVFSEMQDGKRINARTYTVLVRAMDKGVVKIGSRVPIVTGSTKEGGTQIQYLDIGMNIDCRVGPEQDGAVDLMTSVDMESLAPEQPGENHSGDPVIRQVKYQTENTVPLGKQTLLGSADEVDGTRRLQIEVTATKMR